ncbi:hypothetical protein CJJ09_005314 [Candidozyma auris]|nr:hypothetical protein CJJ09_005314 [[Candida] auris]
MVLAIVTGAANGIGRSAALQLAKDGFEVAIIDLPTAKAQAEAVAKEISSNGAKSQFEAAFKDAVKQLGPLDVMVNNAGVSIMDPIELISEEDLQTMFDVNVKSCIWGMPTVGAYAMSKACIKSLTQTAAKEYADLGIMVNCYCPGPIRTDLFEGIVEKSVKLGLASADEVVELRETV